MKLKQLIMKSKPVTAQKPVAKVSKASTPVTAETPAPVSIGKPVKLNAAEREAISALAPNLRKQARAGILAKKTAKREARYTSPEYLERMEYRKRNREVKSLTWSDDGEALCVTGFQYSKRLFLKPHQWVNLLGLGEEIVAAIEAKGFDLSDALSDQDVVETIVTDGSEDDETDGEENDQE